MNLQSVCTALVLSFLCVSIPLRGQCAPETPGRTTSNWGTISLVGIGFSNAELNAASGYWLNACPGYGTSFPSMVAGSPGDITVTVQHVAGNSTSVSGGCAFWQPALNAQNQLVGGTITVWDNQTNGFPCTPPPVSDSIAHELGHVLGLSNSDCIGSIMGPGFGSNPRTVPAEACTNADGMWYTPYEQPPPPPDPHLEDQCYEYCSPIIVGLENGEIQLSGTADPVPFDIDADGLPELTTWTATGSRVAFLALDRNGNGKIDSGRELFGNATLLSTGGTAKNGYVALAEFDRLDMGGNNDGVIGPEDAVWPNLRLWVDANHNGISEPSELSTLDGAHIVAIGYDYTLSWKKDRYGNIFRFKGKAWRQNHSEQLRELETYDVLLQRVR